MGYKVSYTGPVMDEILNKSNKFEANDEAWTLFESVSASDLMTPGNYFANTFKFPSLFGKEFYNSGNTLITQYLNNRSFPNAMVFVRNVNNNIYQYVDLNLLGAFGIANTNSTVVLIWIRQKDGTYQVRGYFPYEQGRQFLRTVESKIYFNENDVNNYNDELRYITSTKEFVYYDTINRKLKDYIQNAMPKSVYGTITNVFEIIDETLSNTYHDDLAKEHSEDSSIHLSTMEKATIDSKATNDYVTEKLEVLSTTINSEITPLLTPIKKIITDSLSSISTDKTSLETHEDDAVKHPTEAKKTSWDNKADGNHTHTSSQIKISTSDVTGVIPAARIPNTAKDIQISVADQTALLALTSSKVQNGDWILVTTDPVEYYVVVDQTKLKTMAAFQKLSPDEISADKKTWENVQNKPNTMKDIIGDEYISANDVSTYDTAKEMQKLGQNVTSNVNTATKKLDYISEDYRDYAVNTETLIDLIDYKIKIIKDILKNK